ncbi:MAG: helix-turn-helix domain-containing protein [Bacteroidales bacterium]|nr:helix-turn-helix domain-containing protein [Bacteroidales bacterium]
MSESNFETLIQEIKELREDFRNYTKANTYILGSDDKWLSMSDLINYLPDKTARATIYGWVSQGIIPYHKYGKKLTFLKSEIDYWLFNNAGAETTETPFEIQLKKIEHFR